MILAEVAYGPHTDYLACCITSQNDQHDGTAIEVSNADMVDQEFMKDDPQSSSFVRPHCLWTMCELVVVRKIDQLSPTKFEEAVEVVRQLLA